MGSRFGRAVKFPLRRRHAIFVLGFVVTAEQSHIDIGPFDFFQIKIVGPPVRCRNILKQKHFEEPPHQHIAMHIVAQRRSFLGEFTLHTAYKNTKRFHFSVRLPVWSNAVVSASLSETGNPTNAR